MLIINFDLTESLIFSIKIYQSQKNEPIDFNFWYITNTNYTVKFCDQKHIVIKILSIYKSQIFEDSTLLIKICEHADQEIINILTDLITSSEDKNTLTLTGFLNPNLNICKFLISKYELPHIDKIDIDIIISANLLPNCKYLFELYNDTILIDDESIIYTLCDTKNPELIDLFLSTYKRIIYEMSDIKRYIKKFDHELRKKIYKTFDKYID